MQAQAGGPQVDPQKPLRCFVNGQLVGMMTADCAQRNGVATDALDVGVDDTGQMAAANPLPESDTPLAPSAAAPSADEPPDAQIADANGQGDCLRYAGAGWRNLGRNMTLQGCVALLFDGRCARGGPPAYGRWGEQTLRQSPGEIDISGDNKDFHPLVDQSPPDCSVGDF